jgi:glycosyltransferase involved in cell wall biosynthesis
MANILVSIIVPIYNTSQYLSRCIDSLINQTLENIEIILIDDGSTDNSFEICKKYEKDFKNIRIYSQKNSGQGVARNYGIGMAKGQYVCFVDSDDYVDCNMYKSLYNMANAYNCDICIVGHEKIYNNINAHMCDVNASYGIKVDSEDILKDFLLQKISSFPWDKLFRREFLLTNNIKFPEGYYFEDINFVIKTLYNSKKIAITNEPYYKYLQRSNSTTFTVSKKHLNDFEVQVNEMFKFVENSPIFKNMTVELENCKFVYTNMLLKMIKRLEIEDTLRSYFEDLPKNLIIFGASSAGELIQYYCNKFDINILYFSDNSKEKWGKTLNNIEIICPQDLVKNEECHIFIASMYYKEIHDQLIRYGLKNRLVDLNIF